jgi:hypothetical protein
MLNFNQRGASIIEVVVMSGAMIAMMIGFMSLMNHESESITYLEDKLSSVALENELRLQFTNNSAGDFCNNLLSGVKAP